MQPSQPLPKWISWGILFLAVIGFADAAYLSAKHFQGETPTCILFSGCDVVTTSAYSTIGPVPIALLGSLFYLSVLILVLYYLDKKDARAMRLLSWIAVPGFLFTFYLLYLQAFVLDAWCIYCVASAVSSISIFSLSQLGRHRLRDVVPIMSQN